MRKLSQVLLIAFLPIFLFAQNTISGTVTDASTGETLAGANVVVVGTSMGAAATADGSYSISNVPDGSYTLTSSVIGYADGSQSVNVSGDATVNFSLSVSALELSAVEILASRASDKTPVAYTNITKAEVEARLGSQDIPMILNTTPSVYATQQGGGAGDARINVRGFNQRNIAVMINGVPQNDMENGWVYWSNWDGVGDATSSIQMQRGLSAVNLATPSIGGTMNIITDPTSLNRGGKFKQEFGAGGFLKTTANYNTGLINDKMAFSATIVRKTGDGIMDGNWTDAWAYYFGASYAISDGNRLELYAIGAPQRHGQNLYRQNMAAYGKEGVDFAKEQSDYDQDALEKFGNGDRLFSQNWGPISSSYKGKQYWYMYGARKTDRYNSSFLNERENFFHKPLVNMNHFFTVNDNMRLSTVAYWSGGSGGGTGTYGSSFRNPAVEGKKWYASSPWTWNWDGAIAANSNNVDTAYDPTKNRSKGILRNSINRQDTYGVISKLNMDVNSSLKTQVGIDWRTASIEHAREVRDLLGGDYFVYTGNDNDKTPASQMKVLGDIVAYHNNTTVDWLGFYAQGNYVSGPINAYGMIGQSSIAYSYQDMFTTFQKKITADAISTMQIKGGLMYDISENISLFGNYGLVEKPPILDNIIYYDGTVASNPVNEKFNSMEFGVNYNSSKYALKVNYYDTQWKDRNLTKSVTTGQGSSGDTDVIFLTGVDQSHTGIEIEGSAQLIDILRLDFAASFGTWKFADDASGIYTDYSEETTTQTQYSYALKDLWVGDMPQTGLVIGATATPLPGLSIQGVMNYYDKNYADWSPGDREISGGTADREQVWMAPSYSKIDLHAYYNLPMQLAGTNIQLFAHVFNLTDALFIQDATDNSQYNSWDKDHDADSAEIFFGTPRYMNMGISVRF
jgi:iron complex outermembrane recepter protein